MAYCGKCGNKLDDGAKFCNKCGNSMNSKKSSDCKVETRQTSDVQATQPSCDQTRKNMHSSSASSSSKAVMAMLVLIMLAGVGVACFYGYKYFEMKKQSTPSVAESGKKLQDDNKEEDRKTKDKPSDSRGKTTSEKEDASQNSSSLQQVSGDCIFPDSSNSLISEEKLAGLSKESLALARNEIYARHGFLFKTEPYASYFRDKSWYKPDPSYDGGDSRLNQVEKDNIKRILKHENKA